MNKPLFILLSVAVIAPTGCTMAPSYSRPAAPVPAKWPSGPAYAESVSVTNAPATALPAWREFFPDERLQKIIRTALNNNRDLRLAVQNVERSRAMYGIQRAALMPVVNATGSLNKQSVPADLSSTGARQTVERYDAKLGAASWEIDFFGRIRSMKDRALQDYLGTEEARRSAQNLLVSSTANAWLTLAADRENLRLSETTLASQEGIYNLVKSRHNLGLAAELDLFRAQTQVDAARGDVVRFTQVVAQDQNALNLLAGAPTPEALLPAGLDSVAPPKELAAGLSSEALLLRPDVLQAETQLKAAHADIGAARATFFPRISLTAAIGTASSDLSGLFKAGSGAWSYTPEIVMPVFDARTWSAYRAAKVQREMAVTQYEKAIQSAFREIADALAWRGSADRQVAAQQSLVHAVSETHRLSGARYDQGIDSYLSVLDSQRSLYAAQQGLVSLRLARLASQVRLYAVMGGGADWEKETNSAATKPVASQAKSQ